MKRKFLVTMMSLGISLTMLPMTAFATETQTVQQDGDAAEAEDSEQESDSSGETGENSEGQESDGSGETGENSEEQESDGSGETDENSEEQESDSSGETDENSEEQESDGSEETDENNSEQLGEDGEKGTETQTTPQTDEETDSEENTENETETADLRTLIQAGGEVTLSENVDNFAAISITKDITIDLNGYNISGTNFYFYVDGVTLTIKGNGTVDPNGQWDTIQVHNSGKVIIEEDVTVKASNNGYAVFLTGDCTNAEVTVKGTLTGANGLTVNGNITSSNKIGIDGATINVDGHGLYLAGKAETTIKNATIVGGATGIEIRAGELTIESGEIKGGSSDLVTAPNGNGSTVDHAALAVSQHTTNQAITVVISGGTFTGKEALYEDDLQDESDKSANVTITLTGVVDLNGNKYKGSGGYTSRNDKVTDNRDAEPAPDSSPSGSDSSSDDGGLSSGSSASAPSAAVPSQPKPVAEVASATKAGAEIKPTAVQVPVISADGKTTTVTLDKVIAAKQQEIVQVADTIAALTVGTVGADVQPQASVQISALLTVEPSPVFCQTVNYLSMTKGSAIAVNNCGTVRTAASARDEFGNNISSAGVVKNVTNGALIMLMGINADGTIEYVEGVVDPVTGAVLGIFQGTPCVITVLVLA